MTKYLKLAVLSIIMMIGVSIQAQQTTGSPIQPPRIQPVTPPQDQTRQQYANLNPYDIVSPLIRAQG